jgi:hypothetical protein
MVLDVTALTGPEIWYFVLMVQSDSRALSYRLQCAAVVMSVLMIQISCPYGHHRMW